MAATPLLAAVAPPSPPPRPRDGPFRTRWLRSARVARLLAAAVDPDVAYVSAELVLRGPGGFRHPDVALLLGPPPPDGVVDRPPLLEVVLGPGASIHSGRTAAVRWEVGDRGVTVVGAGQRELLTGRAVLPPPPGPAVFRLRLRVRDLCARPP